MIFRFGDNGSGPMHVDTMGGPRGELIDPVSGGSEDGGLHADMIEPVHADIDDPRGEFSDPWIHGEISDFIGDETDGFTAKEDDWVRE